MTLKNVFQQIRFQTPVGWTAGYLAGIALNAMLGQKFNEKFWLSMGGVLVVRILVDLAFAFKEAKQNLSTDEHR